MLVVALTSAGLYLAVFPPFRPGHPPLLIPWGEIEAREEGRWFKRIALTFTSVPGVRVGLPQRFVAGMAEARVRGLEPGSAA